MDYDDDDEYGSVFRRAPPPLPVTRQEPVEWHDRQERVNDWHRKGSHDPQEWERPRKGSFQNVDQMERRGEEEVVDQENGGGWDEGGDDSNWPYPSFSRSYEDRENMHQVDAVEDGGESDEDDVFLQQYGTHPAPIPDYEDILGGYDELDSQPPTPQRLSRYSITPAAVGMESPQSNRFSFEEETYDYADSYWSQPPTPESQRPQSIQKEHLSVPTSVPIPPHASPPSTPAMAPSPRSPSTPLSHSPRPPSMPSQPSPPSTPSTPFITTPQPQSISPLPSFPPSVNISPHIPPRHQGPSSSAPSTPTTPATAFPPAAPPTDRKAIREALAAARKLTATGQVIPPSTPSPLQVRLMKPLPQSGGDIFSAPVANETSIPYSPHPTSAHPSIPSHAPPIQPPAPPTSAHPSHAPPIQPPAPPLPPRPTPTQIEDLLEKGRLLLLQTADTSSSFPLAQKVWQEAVALSQATNDSFREARALNNLSCLYRRAGSDAELWDCLDRAWGLAVTAMETAIVSTGDDPLDEIYDDDAPIDEDADTREMARRRRLKRVMVMLRVNMPEVVKSEEKVAKRREANPALRALKMLGVEGTKMERINSNGGWGGNGSGSTTLERMQTWSGGTQPLLKKPSTLLDIDPNLIHLIPGVRSERLADAQKSKPTGGERLRQVGPPIYVLFMDICTSIGNAHFVKGKYLNAMTWHQSCLDLAQDAFIKWPLTPMSSRDMSIKLSYLHRSSIIARSRSFSHMGLCLHRLGEPHRAVKFHHRAITSLNVAGPQTQLNAPLVRASLVGNLAGRSLRLEGRRLLGDLRMRFGGLLDVEIGWGEGQMNAAACWIEAGGLDYWVGNPPGFKTLQRGWLEGCLDGYVEEGCESCCWRGTDGSTGGGSSGGGLLIPPRMHSAQSAKKENSQFAAIQTCVERARRERKEWLVDLLGAIKMLLVCVEESRKLRDWSVKVGEI
ncbi:hypothetical protein BC829DRAFT_448964 [Chytridium lagenaria]|nr:hypothetical protein BC829DRAFT_448964 [Chytridium lagenaria]